MSTVRERVAAGAAKLDQAMPDWAEQIDTSKLQLENVYRCVLGQLYEDYYDGLSHLFGFDNWTSNHDLARDHGFDVSDTALSYDNLRRQWVTEIRARKAA